MTRHDWLNVSNYLYLAQQQIDAARRILSNNEEEKTDGYLLAISDILRIAKDMTQ